MKIIFVFLSTFFLSYMIGFTQITIQETEQPIEDYHFNLKKVKKTEIHNGKQLSWFIFKEKKVNHICFQLKILYLPQDSIIKGNFVDLNQVEDNISFYGTVDKLISYKIKVPIELQKRKIVDVFMRKNQLQILYEGAKNLSESPRVFLF